MLDERFRHNSSGIGLSFYLFVKTSITKRQNPIILNKSRIFAVLLMVIVAVLVRAEDAKKVVIANA